MRPRVLEQDVHKIEQSAQKRYACSHCGKTWVEIVGLIAGKINETETAFLHVGHESKACKNCKFRIKSCPACGSKNTYEILFSVDNPQNSLLSFNRIRIVSN